MGFLEALLLSFALCVDTLVVSAATAFRSKMTYRRGLLMALILGFCQAAFPLAGAVVGDVSRAFIEAVDHWIAFGLLAFIGGKMILDQFVGRDREEEDEVCVGQCPKSNVAQSESTLTFPSQSNVSAANAQRRHSDIRTYFLLGVATSIDALAVGIGLGLDNPLGDVLWIVALIGAVTMLVSLVGIFLGKRQVPVPERTASILAGMVLIGLGVKILLEHLL